MDWHKLVGQKIKKKKEELQLRLTMSYFVEAGGERSTLTQPCPNTFTVGILEAKPCTYIVALRLEWILLVIIFEFLYQ